jgi:glycosyltransferase involved in cell wall biosynthesis
MGLLMLRELLRQGIEVDLFVTTNVGEEPPIQPRPGLRIVRQPTWWQWGRWYSATKPSAFLSGLAVRAVCNVLLTVRLLIEHRWRRYDAVYQLSQTELFLLGRLRRWAPPIVVHPCVHAAGELRWHRRESAYALRAERRSVHLLMRAILRLRSRLQPHELARADLVLGLSERFNDLLIEDYGVPRSKLRVVRSPVDTNHFSPNGSELGGSPRTVLFISRISVRKGVPEVVSLSHRLDDLAGSVRLLVIGGPTLWSDYVRHLDDLNPAIAQFVGGVSKEELPTLMGSATMLIVPSQYEPGSIVTAEALACGLPVVLSDEVGNAEVVSGPHVRIHRAGDLVDLEASVRSLLAAIEADESALRASARANAEREFSAEGVVSQLVEMIKERV